MNSRKFWNAHYLTVLATGLLIADVIAEVTWGTVIGGIWLYWYGANHMDKRLK